VSEANRAFDELVVKLTDAGWSMDDITAAFPQYVAAQNDGRDATGETSEATRLLTEALGEQADALNKLFSPVFAAIDGQKKLEEAQRNAAKAADDAAAAQAEYDRVMSDSTSTDEDKNVATLKLLDATGKLEDADYDLIKATVSAESALLKMAEAEAKGETEAGKFKDQLNQWVDQGLITEDQARKMADKFDDVRESAESAAGTYDVNLDSNVDEMLAKFLEAKAILESMPADKVSGAQRLIFGVQPRALGGPVEARTPYLVGEKGPELFVPSGNGRIIPDGETSRLLAPAMQLGATTAGGAGGDTFNFTINGVVAKDKRELLEFLSRELPKAAATHARSFG
jgi:polyhydroxyalkanoate synthesis regulator phasin